MGALHQALLMAKVAGGGGGFGPGPDTISDLQLWLDAFQETGYSNNDEMSTALDFSGNSRDFTGVVGSVKKPRYQATAGPNSQPCFLMLNQSSGSHSGDNQGGYFSRAGFMSGSTAAHGFVVMKRVSDLSQDSGAPWGGTLSTTEDVYFPWSGDGGIYEAWGTNARKTTGNPSPALDAWHLYEIRTASGAYSTWFDGTSHFSTGTNTVGFGGSTYLVGASYESDGSSTRKWWGWIAETFWYNRVLSAGEITTVKTYVNAKHGLTLA